MNATPKITLDTNCVINLIDVDAETPTSVDLLSEIIKLGLQNKIDVGITTKVEADLERDKDDIRKTKMMRTLNFLPVIGGIILDVGSENDLIWRELKRTLFPGLQETSKRFPNKKSDIDHLVGHFIHKRDIFVTDDIKVLNKASELKRVPGIVVMSPKQCVEYIENMSLEKIKRDLSSEKFKQGYHDRRLSGTVTFDFSNNNGKYVIGDGHYLFETKWSGCGLDSMYAYNDPPSIDVIALVKDISLIHKIKNAEIYDTSSRHRTIKKAQILILRNVNKIYAAIKLLEVIRNREEDDTSVITFEYLILSNGLADFT